MTDIPPLPPFPPPDDTGILQRWGVTWPKHGELLHQRMPDGYWTPWHLADARIASLAREVADTAELLAAVRLDKAELRAALTSIANNTCCGPCQEAALVAKRALLAQPARPAEADGPVVISKEDASALADRLSAVRMTSSVSGDSKCKTCGRETIPSFRLTPNGRAVPDSQYVGRVCHDCADQPAQRNQCDGCMAGNVPDAKGFHRHEDGRSYMLCEAGKYAQPAQAAEHFPATSEPSRCCYRFDDESRCSAARDTHSFCGKHAKELRAQPTGSTDQTGKACEAKV